MMTLTEFVNIVFAFGIVTVGLLLAYAVYPYVEPAFLWLSKRLGGR